MHTTQPSQNSSKFELDLDNNFEAYQKIRKKTPPPSHSFEPKKGGSYNRKKMKNPNDFDREF